MGQAPVGEHRGNMIDTSAWQISSGLVANLCRLILKGLHYLFILSSLRVLGHDGLGSGGS